jgi:putative hydrolase of the HAD superfamily
MRPPVEAVVFDVGGVLAGQDLAAADAAYGRLLPGLSAERVNSVRDEPDLYRLWERYSVGQLEAPDYWVPLAQALGLPAPRWRALARVHGLTVWALRDQPVVDLALALRRRGQVRLGVLSNSAPEYEAHIPAVAEPFEVLHFSHQTGHRKPDPEAFFGVADALGALAEQTVLIDDKDRNVGAAEELGMTGITFSSAPRLAGCLLDLGVPSGTTT